MQTERFVILDSVLGKDKSYQSSSSALESEDRIQLKITDSINKKNCTKVSVT